MSQQSGASQEQLLTHGRCAVSGKEAFSQVSTIFNSTNLPESSTSKCPIQLATTQPTTSISAAKMPNLLPTTLRNKAFANQNKIYILDTIISRNLHEWIVALSPEANNPTQQNLPKALAQSVDVPLHNHRALRGRFNMDRNTQVPSWRTKIPKTENYFYTNKHSLQVAYRKIPFGTINSEVPYQKVVKDWWNLGGELPQSQTPPRSLPRPSPYPCTLQEAHRWCAKYHCNARPIGRTKDHNFLRQQANIPAMKSDWVGGLVGWLVHRFVL